MAWTPEAETLRGRVAVVAGATRGAGRGIAAALGEVGATVICTGRSSVTGAGGSDYDRPETIEETAELVTGLGGTGIAIQLDHLDSEQVRLLAERVRDEHGHIDVLVNDIWVAEVLNLSLRARPRAGTLPSGNTTSTTACGSCAWPSTRTSSHLTICFRC